MSVKKDYAVQRSVTNHIIVPAEITPELAYLCGVLLGDGCISHRPKKKEWIIACQGNINNEKDYYDNVLIPLVGKVFGLKVKVRKQISKGTYGFAVGSKELALYMLLRMNFPLGKKHEQLQIPYQLLASEETMFAFIRGLFDTDGCISFKKRHKRKQYYPVISFCSKNEFFVEQVASILFVLGFTPRIHTRYNADDRFAGGGNHISHLMLNGYSNFSLWQRKIGFGIQKMRKKLHCMVNPEWLLPTKK